MQIEIRQESPLVGAHDLLGKAPAHRFDVVQVQEIAFLELNNIRGDAASPLFLQAINDELDVALPTQPNTVSIGDKYVAWWLGPNEWLAQSVQPQHAVLEPALRARFDGQFASTVDVSSGYTVLRLSGARACDVLQKGCPLDLHPVSFTQGQCAQTVFFKTAIAVRKCSDDAFDIIVRRSFADYAARMILDAAHEFYQ